MCLISVVFAADIAIIIPSLRGVIYSFVYRSCLGLEVKIRRGFSSAVLSISRTGGGIFIP